MNTKLNIAAAAAMITMLATGAQASCPLVGTAGDDTLSSSVPCHIAGLGGNDTITGSSGTDVIYPGANSLTHPGTDVMTGNGDTDAFVFETSNSLGAHADVITDFQHGTDKVYVMPACSAAGVTCFWAGSGFSGTPGEVVYTVGGGNGTISIDFDGDSTPDYQIKLSGAPAFDSGDIVFTAPPPMRRFIGTLH